MINCPICSSSLNLEQTQASCAEGHQFSVKNGAYQLLKPEFKERLEKFLTAFEDFRQPYIEGMKKIDFNKLPYINGVLSDERQWKAKRMDLELITRLKAPGEKVLELGAWNGWLSNRLVEEGYEVLAADIFIHELDGLGASKHYRNQWQSVQMNMDDVSILKSSFDLIIINRSIAFFKDLNQTIIDLKARLNPGGLLFITGINYCKDPSLIIDRYKQAEELFNSKYNAPYAFFSSKGYMDAKDLSLLRAHKIKLSLYPSHRWKPILKWIYPKRSISYYGCYEKTN